MKQRKQYTKKQFQYLCLDRTLLYVFIDSVRTSLTATRSSIVSLRASYKAL